MGGEEYSFLPVLILPGRTTEKHIKELEYEYKTIKSEVIFRSKASELVKAVAPLGLRELTMPPVMLEDSIEKK
jgi:hypothetical protein